MKPPSLTIGIEEEYQIINPETGELTSYITEILESDHVVLREQMKPELHQSVVEVGSVVCETAAEARQEVIRLRRLVSEKVAESGLRIAAAGTHPFSFEQEVVPQAGEKFWRMPASEASKCRQIEMIVVIVAHDHCIDWRQVFEADSGRSHTFGTGKRDGAAALGPDGIGE